MRCWGAEVHGAVMCGCAVVCVGQQVGIIFSLGASCLGPARPTAYSRSRVGVDGVSAVTHTTHGVLPMMGDTTAGSALPACGYFELLSICLLPPHAHQKWLQCIGHYTFISFSCLLFFPPQTTFRQKYGIYLFFDQICIWGLYKESYATTPT